MATIKMYSRKVQTGLDLGRLGSFGSLPRQTPSFSVLIRLWGPHTWIKWQTTFTTKAILVYFWPCHGMFLSLEESNKYHYQHKCGYSCVRRHNVSIKCSHWCIKVFWLLWPIVLLSICIFGWDHFWQAASQRPSAHYEQNRIS